MDNKRISIFLEVLSAFFLVISLYPVLRYGMLAGVRVPQHFTKGCVDIWTGREMFIYLALIFVAIYALLSLCQLHPNWVNIPFDSKMSVEARASLGKSIAGLLKVWCMADFAFLSISAYRIALGKAQCLNNTVQCIIVLCAVVHLVLILMFRKD
ncbi:MAG: hypothetical protein Q4G10_02805 [Bacteroidia bacterium]|nr:hypothetical protein [Bacteroidia bacterium]